MDRLQTFELSFPNEAQAKVKVQISTYRNLTKYDVESAFINAVKVNFPSKSLTESVKQMVMQKGNYLLCLQGPDCYQFFPV